MSIEVFSFDCDALGGAKLAGFKGIEGLSRPFELDVFFTVPVGTDVKSAIGARATLTADRDDGRGAMCWHGILAGIRLLHETAERALYRGALVPNLWLLQQYVRSFVHTKKKIDAFAADTLKHGGLSTNDFHLSIHTSAYPVEELVCQYRESHLDFLHRWFEREGLYYYFEHPDNAGEPERVIVVDDKTHHHPLFGAGHVRYFPAAGHDATAGECLRELHADFKLLPASVLITDYNYANPAAPVGGEKTVSEQGRGEIREYGYRVFTEAEAKRLAQVKAQSIACRELVLSATGTYLGLRAGYTFEVDEGPSDLPAKYLAIEVRHAGMVSGSAAMVMRYTGLDAKETYRVDVVAIPANVQYRSPQSTPWPRIYGVENGTVDGPGESQYAQIDDQGRYLVRMKFDASDLQDGSTSTYLRMMQPHGGTTEGWHFPLRKGTEVMVSFQGGDPDRPLIAGVVPNAVQPSNVTSKNYTQNVLKTGGGSYLIFDDLEDQQCIDGFVQVGNTGFHMGYSRGFQTTVPPAAGTGTDEPQSFDFTYVVNTDGDTGFKVGGSWWQKVGATYTLDVKTTGRVRFGSNYTLIVGGNTVENYGGSRKNVITSGYQQQVFGGLEQEITGGGSQSVTGAWLHKVSATSCDDYGAWTTEVKGAWTAHMGNISILSDGPVTISAPAVTINGANVQTKASGFYKGFTPLSLETFGSKNSAGVQKADYTTISISVTGQKNDVVGTSNSVTGVKIDATGLKLDVTAAKISNSPVEIRDHGLEFAFNAIHNVTSGLIKMG